MFLLEINQKLVTAAPPLPPLPPWAPLPDQNMNICFGTTTPPAAAAAASVVVEDVISIGLTVDIVPKTKESILDVNTVNCCPCAACQRDGG